MLNEALSEDAKSNGIQTLAAYVLNNTDEVQIPFCL